MRGRCVTLLLTVTPDRCGIALCAGLRDSADKGGSHEQSGKAVPFGSPGQYGSVGAPGGGIVGYMTVIGYGNYAGRGYNGGGAGGNGFGDGGPGGSGFSGGGGGFEGGGGGGEISGSGGVGYGCGGGGSYSFVGTPFSLAYQSGNGAVSINSIPEPSTWAMMLAGFAGLGALALRRKRKLTPA